MKKLAFLVLVLLASCKENEIEIDAEQFCSCRRANLSSPEKCNKILEKLSIKYQFDSEGSGQLQDAINECLPIEPLD